MRRRYLMATVASAALLVGGCKSGSVNPQQQSELGAGYSSLQARQYDDATRRADEYLRKYPGGAGSAEAYYLRGRALEERTAASPTESIADLRAARQSYEDALQQHPSPKLEGYIRASLGNVAYNQDDDNEALNQWTAALPKLTDEQELASQLLYRTGVAQQRIGRFTDAADTFDKVVNRYPGTAAAQKAQDRQQDRSFYVQVATFSNESGADRAIQQLKDHGVSTKRGTDAHGRAVISIGPLQSYEDAKNVKARVLDLYPDAQIQP